MGSTLSHSHKAGIVGALASYIAPLPVVQVSQWSPACSNAKHRLDLV
jgi:hypothetical protein